MIGLLIVTHGDMADELVNVCFKIIGAREKIDSCSIQWDDDPNESTRKIEKKLKQLDNGKGVLVLTDMFGGTPTNIMISLSKKYNLDIITGVNLPMLIKAATIMANEDELSLFADKIKSQGQKNIYKVSDILSMKGI